MIKELAKKDEFFYSDPVFRKYFVDRKKTEFEKSKELEVYNMVFDFLKKTFNISGDNFKNLIYRMGYFSFGAYLEDYGFYSLSDADRGYYDIEYYGEDINIAFYKLVDDILFDYAHDNERDNRKKYMSDFDTRFDVKGNKYFSSLYETEYIIDKWDKYYEGNIPEYIIAYYEEQINDFVWSQENNTYWKYNRETKKFEPTKKKYNKVRKLEK